jgi:hypothetical protein
MDCLGRLSRKYLRQLVQTCAESPLADLTREERLPPSSRSQGCGRIVVNASAITRRIRPGAHPIPVQILRAQT